jgi:hypothetical protein
MYPAETLPGSAAPVPLAQILLPCSGGVAGSPVRRLAPALARLLAFWQDLYRENVRPRRRDLRPERLTAILPALSLIDVLPDSSRPGGRRFRHRLLGTAHRRHNTADLTGRYMDEVQPPQRAAWAELAWNEIIDRVQPGFWRQYHLRGLPHGTPFHFYERVFVPLFDEDGRPVMLAGAFHWAYLGDAAALADASETDEGVVPLDTGALPPSGV